MQWHAMTMFVRTFSVGRYSDWNRLRGLCETKLLVGNPQSWTKIPMTRSHPGKTAQSLATFWPHLSGSYLLSPQVRQFLHLISFQSIAIFLQNHHKIWVILNAKCFKHVCFGYFVVVAVLWFSNSAVPIDHWPASPTRASKQSQNTFDPAGATVQNVFALRFFVACLTTINTWVQRSTCFLPCATNWFQFVWTAIQVQWHRCKNKGFDSRGVGCARPETSKNRKVFIFSPNSSTRLLWVQGTHPSFPKTQSKASFKELVHGWPQEVDDKKLMFNSWEIADHQPMTTSNWCSMVD